MNRTSRVIALFIASVVLAVSISPKSASAATFTTYTWQEGGVYVEVTYPTEVKVNEVFNMTIRLYNRYTNGDYLYQTYLGYGLKPEMSTNIIYSYTNPTQVSVSSWPCTWDATYLTWMCNQANYWYSPVYNVNYGAGFVGATWQGKFTETGSKSFLVMVRGVPAYDRSIIGVLNKTLYVNVVP